ncbi:DUF6893 family small protein [Pedococcus sp.]|jgi:hypothetical protein
MTMFRKSLLALVLAAAAFVVVQMVPDLKRYLELRRM